MVTTEMNVWTLQIPPCVRFYKLHTELTKENPLTSSKVMTEQVNGPYFREVVNTTGKPGSIYS